MRLTLAAAIEARDDALRRVDVNADESWREDALAAVRQTCQRLRTFISDDIWTTGDLIGTREDRALGPVMLRAARQGWCRKTDRMRPSVRSHASGKPVWESLIYEEGRL